MRYNKTMSFELIGQHEVEKENGTYVIKAYFDSDTNTQKNEYCLNKEVLFSQEYEMHYLDEPENDLDIDSVVEGFEYWFGIVGPDWRPQGF